MSRRPAARSRRDRGRRTWPVSRPPARSSPAVEAVTGAEAGAPRRRRRRRRLRRVHGAPRRRGDAGAGRMDGPAGTRPRRQLAHRSRRPSEPLGGATAGQSVLIHAAAGATGQAAVTLAKHLGATVIATASPSKHDDRARAGRRPRPGLARRRHRGRGAAPDRRRRRRRRPGVGGRRHVRGEPGRGQAGHRPCRGLRRGGRRRRRSPTGSWCTGTRSTSSASTSAP